MRGACVGTVVCATNRSVASTLSSEKSNESDNESDEASDASSDASSDSSRDEDNCTDCTGPAGDRGALHMPQDVARCGFKY